MIRFRTKQAYLPTYLPTYVRTYLEHLHDDGVPESESDRRHGLSAGHALQQLVVAPADSDRQTSYRQTIHIHTQHASKHAVELVSLTYPPQMARSCPVRSKPSNTTPV